jgi:hypothetical protein
MGRRFGKTAYILLRDRGRVKRPSVGDLPSSDAGVLEASGSVFVDNPAEFDEMSKWGPAKITDYVDRLASSIAPDPRRVKGFEAALGRLFPR